MQNLLLRIFTAEYGENPRWCCVKGMNHTKSALVVFIPCLDRKTVNAHRDHAPLLMSLLESTAATSMRTSGEIEHFPGDQGSSRAGCRMLKTILSAHARQAVTSKKKALFSSPPKKLEKPPISSYLATPEEMARSGYPEPECGSQPGWITTSSSTSSRCTGGTDDAASDDPDQKHLVALDCEMVTTCSGPALARVSVVALGDAVLLDAYVKPAEEVTDYLTEFSGITKEMLDSATMTLGDVQAKLLELLTAESILVGHSLENDFQVLRLVHRRVIDTALIYPNSRGWPHRQSLQGLCTHFLKRKLDRKSGHDSVADASAALQLALLKFEKGPGFGAPGGECVPLGRLLRAPGVGLSLVDPFAAGDAGGALSSWHTEHCSIEAEASENSQQARTVRLTMLREFEDFCQASVSTKAEDSFAASGACLRGLDAKIRNMLESLGEEELLMLMTGCGDLHRLRAVGAAGTTPPELEERRRLRERFKDAFGIFLVGGSPVAKLALEATASEGLGKTETSDPQPLQVQPPLREIVTYDL